MSFPPVCVWLKEYPQLLHIIHKIRWRYDSSDLQGTHTHTHPTQHTAFLALVTAFQHLWSNDQLSEATANEMAKVKGTKDIAQISGLSIF